MTFASKLLRMLALASLTGLGLADSACIATDRIDFVAEENFPPSVVSQQGAEYPLNEIGMLNLDDPLPPDQPAELLLQTVVRDPNFDETLEYRIYLNSDESAAEFPIDEDTIEPTGFVEREREFAIPFERFDRGMCNKIELVVVGQFANFVTRNPVVPGDFDQVTWWVEVTDTDNPESDRCR